MISRRTLIFGAGGVAGSLLLNADENDDLTGKFGLVTASLNAHFAEKSKPGKITLLDFPSFLRDELGFEIIDFNTMNFHTLEKVYLEKLKVAIDRSSCIATNLKMNQRVDMSSLDPEARAHALQVYKESIDAAAFLGLRWVRPLPRSEVPDRQIYLDSYNELIDYAGERGITVLIENFGWMSDDPNSVVDLATALGKSRVGVGLDTGNWRDNTIRYPALEKTFPLAVTCDFKAKEITQDFEHPAYDLKQCFDIAIAAGYSGPWIFEHGHKSLPQAVKELRWLHGEMIKWGK